MPTPSRTDDIDRAAFNAAFCELGLRWHWDDATYDALRVLPGERDRVQRYLQAEQPHLLRAYEPGFLADAILDAKARCQRALAQVPPGPAGACAGFDWARWTDARWGEVGV